jgi:Raf kinase inhibitor-like YbhB/YbcL family protein
MEDAVPDLNLGELTINSPAFGHGEAIPERHSNAGGDTIPELRWSNVPVGTRELVLVVHDPDAPLTDGFTHWVAFGIDPGSDGLEEGATEGYTSGLNSIGDAAYMGPAPPAGHDTHHYFFHLYALDTPLEFDGLPDRASVLEQIDGHIIEQARTVGTYRND